MDDAAVVADAMEFHPREEELFSDALELPANRRVAFVTARSGASASLRARVLDLLQAHAAAADFLEDPAGSMRERRRRPDAPALSGDPFGPETTHGQGVMIPVAVVIALLVVLVVTDGASDDRSGE